MRKFAACLIPIGLLLLGCGGGSPVAPPPQASGWALTDPLASPNSGSVSIALTDGRVLLVGGGPSSATHLFDPVTALWSDGPRLVHGRRAGLALTMLANDRVLILGGVVGDALTSAEVFDPATNTTTLAAGTSSVLRSAPLTALLPDGRVLVAGGTDGTFPMVGTTVAEIWDPATGLFTPTDSLATGRAASGIATLATGEVLVIGGDGGGIFLSSCELFDPILETWGGTGSLIHGRASLAGHVARAGDGRILVTGGSVSGAELYDPATGSWSLRTDTAHAAGHTAGVALALADGRILMAGGFISGSTTGGHAEIFDPIADLFAAINPMRLERLDMSAAQLGDGRVLVVGGISTPAIGRTETCELYSP